MKEQSEIESILREAGEILMKYWPGGEAGTIGVDYKEDGSPVTKADKESDTFIRSRLSLLFPQDGIVSEEAQETKSSNGRVWILDPLDGTNSFISGLDDFSILAALCENHEVVYGSMYFPALNIYASASKGQGAFSNGQRLEVSSDKFLRERGLYHRNFEPPPGTYLFDKKLDSGRAFLSLCEGGFDGIVMRTEQFGEHDFAAPAILIKESGGRVSDEFGKPIRFHDPSHDYKYFVVSNTHVHEQLLDIIARS